MDARFPRKELVRRIEAIASKKHAIKLKNWDAERFITNYLPSLPEQSLVYCDPPYFQQGHRLYLSRYCAADHERIAHVIQDACRGLGSYLTLVLQKFLISTRSDVRSFMTYSTTRSVYTKAGKYLYFQIPYSFQITPLFDQLMT